MQIVKQEDVAGLRQFLELEYLGRAAFEVVSGTDEKATIGVIIVAAEDAANVRRALEERRMTLFRAPDDLDSLPFPEQRQRVAARITEKKKHLALLAQQQESFANRWYQAYQQARARIESRLSLINHHARR